jgi:ankyrin repeat protein
MEKYFILLISNNCNINEKNYKGLTPLMIALKNENIEFIKLALKS